MKATHSVSFLPTTHLFLSPKHNKDLKTPSSESSEKIHPYAMILKPYLLSYALTTLASALPSELSQRQAVQCDATLADTFNFDIPIGAFLDHKASMTPACFDWSDDGCSCSLDRPAGYDFLPSCYRHDFGYRNNKPLTPEKKLSIDDKFQVCCLGFLLSLLCFFDFFVRRSCMAICRSKARNI